MEFVKPYFDYNISDKSVTSGTFDKIADRLLQLGYHTVAINQTIEESNAESSKRKKKKGDSRDNLNDIVPSPVDVEQYNNDYKELKILNRLTIIFSNQDFLNKILKSTNYKRYHVIAVMPTSQQAFQFACGSIEADILAFDPENKLNYKINRKQYNQLADKGVYFEILYSPAIQDSSQRKNCISNAHMYHACGKSKNIIVSSGATQDYFLRSPYDIINLGLIFGLSEQQAKNAISSNGRNVYIHSVGRRLGKTIMLVEDVEQSREDTVVESGSEGEEMEVDQPAQKKSKQ